MRKFHIALIASLFICRAFAAGMSDLELYYSPTNQVVESGWINVEDTHYVLGPKLSPDSLNERLVVVHRWCLACPKIDAGVKGFNNLFNKYHASDIAFVTSYYPSAPHKRTEVNEAMKRYKVRNPVYVGAAPDISALSKRHRSLYVVSAGGEVLWSTLENSDTHELEKELQANLEQWRLGIIEKAAETRPGLAYVWIKQFKKTYPKSAAKVKDVFERINNAKVRSLCEMEESLIKLQEKPDPRKIKSQMGKVEAFRKNCPGAYHAELDRMLDDLSKML